MNRWFLVLIFSVGLISNSCTEYRGFNKEIKAKPVMNLVKIDGVFEFISETTFVAKPTNEIENKTNKDWKGLWFFGEGHFCRNMMKIDRSNWMPDDFPSNNQEIGFDSVSGTFQIDFEKRTISFKKILTLFPGNMLINESYDYELNGNLLTLTQLLSKNRHTMSEGKRVIVLRQIKGKSEER